VQTPASYIPTLILIFESRLGDASPKPTMTIPTIPIFRYNIFGYYICAIIWKQIVKS
jgi:hypothetical protein